MNNYEKQAIEALGKRSYRFVMIATSFLAIGGGIVTRFTEDHWMLWIPFCFLVIPAMHHLGKLSVELTKRIERLEQQLIP